MIYFFLAVHSIISLGIHSSTSRTVNTMLPQMTSYDHYKVTPPHNPYWPPSHQPHINPDMTTRQGHRAHQPNIEPQGHPGHKRFLTPQPRGPEAKRHRPSGNPWCPQTMVGQRAEPSSLVLHDRKWAGTQILVHHGSTCAPLPTTSWALSECTLIVSYGRFAVPHWLYSEGYGWYSWYCQRGEA